MQKLIQIHKTSDKILLKINYNNLKELVLPFRPIVATFSTFCLKIDLYKQRRVLNDTAYYIKEDFPQNVLEKRKQLQEQLRIEKEKGNSATIKYDILIVRNKNQNSANNNKRMPKKNPKYRLARKTRLKGRLRGHLAYPRELSNQAC